MKATFTVAMADDGFRVTVKGGQAIRVKLKDGLFVVKSGTEMGIYARSDVKEAQDWVVSMIGEDADVGGPSIEERADFIRLETIVSALFYALRDPK